MIPWQNFLENVVRDFEDKGYDFNHIADMIFITLADKMDMSYDLYVKHNMHKVEWKLFSLTNKDKNLINKFNHNNWRHPFTRKYSNVPFNN